MQTPPWDLEAEEPEVAVLVALQEEFLELKDGIGVEWFPSRDEEYGGNLYFWIDPESGYRCVAASSGRMGPEESLRLAERLLRLRPAVLVNVGIAASLHGDIRLGDVVVPDLVYAYDKTAKAIPVRQGDMETWGWERRGDAFRATHALVEAARELVTAESARYVMWQTAGTREYETLRRRNLDALIALEKRKVLRTSPARPEVRVAYLGSGNFVGASRAFGQWVRVANADIKALEMETAGMLLAIEKRLARTPALVIRGVSDHVDVPKAESDAIDEGAFRRLAMHNAVRLLRVLLSAGAFPRHAAAKPSRPSHDQREISWRGGLLRTGRWAALGALALLCYPMEMVDFPEHQENLGSIWDIVNIPGNLKPRQPDEPPVSAVARPKPEPERPPVSAVVPPEPERPPVSAVVRPSVCDGTLGSPSTGGPTGFHLALAGDLSMKMIHLEAGEFTMGGEDPSEIPRHRVCLFSFELSAEEVTQAQWNAVMPPSQRRCVGLCSFSDKPIRSVSWLDALEFTNRLSIREGLDPCYQIESESVTWDISCTGYRLPTEAEWEYAARAGTTGRYSYPLSAQGAFFSSPIEKINPWKFRNVHESAWEWVWDPNGEYETGDVQDPLGPNSRTARTTVTYLELEPHRILRGGLLHGGTLTPSSYRRAERTSALNGGIRVARSPQPRK